VVETCLGERKVLLLREPAPGALAPLLHLAFAGRPLRAIRPAPVVASPVAAEGGTRFVPGEGSRFGLARVRLGPGTLARTTEFKELILKIFESRKPCWHICRSAC